VYGKAGVAWTWEARAKAVGLPTAEAAAEKFQAMLKKPAKGSDLTIGLAAFGAWPAFFPARRALR